MVLIDEQPAAWIECPPGAIPAPGQYLLTLAAGDEAAALSTPLFMSAAGEGRFLAAPPLPAGWQVGMSLALRGPMGHGFALPTAARRVALAALHDGPARLMGLLHQALSAGLDVALFGNDMPANLPARVELGPLAGLPDALHWADFAALDLPLARLDTLRAGLGLAAGAHSPCPGQVLVAAPMPCAGMAACGACALPLRHAWKLVCEDGPVFSLRDLLI